MRNRHSKKKLKQEQDITMYKIMYMALLDRYLELQNKYKKMKNCGNCLMSDKCIYEFAWHVCDNWKEQY